MDYPVIFQKKKLGEESLMATDLIDNLQKAFKKIDN